MADTDYMLVARSDAIQKALGLPLPDAVYEVVRHNHSARSGTYNIPLADLRIKGSLDEIEEWQRRSLQLRNDAYAVGDAGLRSHSNYDRARALLISTNPGFSELTYESAIEFGYQQAR